jgi:hypothetical protein
MVLVESTMIEAFRGLFKCQLPGALRPNIGLPKEVTTRHPGKIPLSAELAPSLETLIRKLVAQACNEPGACAEVSSDGKGRVIIDTEVDGIRCLLTRLEKSPMSRIFVQPA